MMDLADTEGATETALPVAQSPLRHTPGFIAQNGEFYDHRSPKSETATNRQSEFADLSASGVNYQTETPIGRLNRSRFSNGR